MAQIQLFGPNIERLRSAHPEASWTDDLLIVCCEQLDELIG